jgi:hypothetical protein
MEGRGQELQAETQSESGQQTDESLTEHSPNCTQAFWKDKAETFEMALSSAWIGGFGMFGEGHGRGNACPNGAGFSPVSTEVP